MSQKNFHDGVISVKQQLKQLQIIYLLLTPSQFLWGVFWCFRISSSQCSNHMSMSISRYIKEVSERYFVKLIKQKNFSWQLNWMVCKQTFIQREKLQINVLCPFNIEMRLLDYASNKRVIVLTRLFPMHPSSTSRKP